MTLYNNFHREKKVVCDIAVVYPYPINGATSLTRDQAIMEFRAADNTFQRKKLKYRTLCDANHLEFRPLIIESTGKFHPQCKKSFEKGIKLMTAGAHPYVVSITKHCWSSRFSCCIQKCIADAFLSETRVINGNLIRNCQYSENVLGTYRLPIG